MAYELKDPIAERNYRESDEKNSNSDELKKY